MGSYGLPAERCKAPMKPKPKPKPLFHG
jgi:hypothetical protein